MCKWDEKARVVSSRIGAGYVEGYFPQHFIQNFPPHAAQRGQCLNCGRPLDHQEMFPPGRTPRYMCDYCYQQVALSGPKQYCLTCGGQLPADQVQEQMRNPRELRHALHEGLCEDYHSMLAGIVLGVPFQVGQPTRPAGLLPPANEAYTWNQFFPANQRAPQLIDARTGKPVRQVKYLKFPE